MSQHNPPSSSNERNIILALNALREGQIQSIRATAKAFNVCRTTLSRRADGRLSRRDYILNSRKLTSLEESVLTKQILDLDARGLPPRLSIV